MTTEHHRHMERWDELDADLREALVYWYNIARDEDGGDGLDDADREALLGLVDAERFWFWDCPECNERCTHGNPEIWAPHFQGVCNQDYASYPGDPDILTEEVRIALCDDCRTLGSNFRMPKEGDCPPVDAL